MSLLTYHELCALVDQGVLTNVEPRQINAASIDLTLGPELCIEYPQSYKNPFWYEPINLMDKESIHLNKYTMDSAGYVLEPGEFVLASTLQQFNLPADPAIAAEYKLKSTLARNGLGHLLAGWADPGWNGSVLTLELKNESRYHRLRIRPGMSIGQMVFWRGEPVPGEASYAARGQYNNDPAATPSKGLR